MTPTLKNKRAKVENTLKALIFVGVFGVFFTSLILIFLSFIH